MKDRGWDRASLFYSNCQSQIENMVLFSFGGGKQEKDPGVKSRRVYSRMHLGSRP